MVEAEYWDPQTESAVTARVAGEGEVPGLLVAVLAIGGGRGHPALELKRRMAPA